MLRNEQGQDDARNEMQLEANKSIGMFFSQQAQVDPKAGNDKGRITIIRTEAGDELLNVCYESADKINELIKKLKDIDEALVTRSHPKDYRAPTFFGMDFNIYSKHSKDVCRLIKDNLNGLVLPHFMLEGSFSGSSSPYASPCPSPRVKPRA